MTFRRKLKYSVTFTRNFSVSQVSSGIITISSSKQFNEVMRDTYILHQEDFKCRIQDGGCSFLRRMTSLFRVLNLKGNIFGSATNPLSFIVIALML